MVMAVSDLQMFVDLNVRTIPECSLMDLDMNNYARQSGWFNAFDVDRNSFISAEELHRVLVGLAVRKVSLEDCWCIIQYVDEHGDQKVNVRVFQNLDSHERYCVYKSPRGSTTRIFCPDGFQGNLRPVNRPEMNSQFKVMKSLRSVASLVICVDEVY